MPRNLDRNVMTGPWGGGQVLIRSQNSFILDLPVISEKQITLFEYRE